MKGEEKKIGQRIETKKARNGQLQQDSYGYRVVGRRSAN